MEVKINIPGSLQKYTNNEESISVSAQTVGEALQSLSELFPALAGHIFADGSQLRSFINVYVNSDDIRFLQKQQTSLSKGDVLTLIPAIAGG